MQGRHTSLQLLNDLTEACKSNIKVNVIYLDFMKAFNTVLHDRLLYEISRHGIKDPVHGWIRSFLRSRSQYVMINGCKYELVAVASGIPQGSVHGPLLFVIYIIDLHDSFESNGYLFADDAKIYKSINLLIEYYIFQHDIDNLTKWSSDWLFTINPDKCKHLKVENNTFKDYDYVMQNHTLQFISQKKDLEVIFNFRLSFDAHINDKVSNANKILGLIIRTSTFLDEVTLGQLNKAFVRSHLEFSNCVWSPSLSKHIDIIKNVQRRATKLA